MFSSNSSSFGYDFQAVRTRVNLLAANVGDALSGGNNYCGYNKILTM
jgi:hypothetical protein